MFEQRCVWSTWWFQSNERASMRCYYRARIGPADENLLGAHYAWILWPPTDLHLESNPLHSDTLKVSRLQLNSLFWSVWCIRFGLFFFCSTLFSRTGVHQPAFVLMSPRVFFSSKTNQADVFLGTMWRPRMFWWGWSSNQSPAARDVSLQPAKKWESFELNWYTIWSSLQCQVTLTQKLQTPRLMQAQRWSDDNNATHFLSPYVCS